MSQNRRPIRATRYRLRFDGLSALEKQKQKSRMRCIVQLLLANGDVCTGMAARLLVIFMRTRNVGLRNIQSIQRTDLRINMLEEDYCYNNLRFRKVHLRPLLVAWDVPRVIVLPNRSVYDGEEAFLLFLRKFGKGAFTVDLEREFGRENTQLVRAIRAMVDLMYEKHKHLVIDNLAFFIPRYEEFNRAIRARIRQRFPGQVLSGAALNTGNLTYFHFVRLADTYIEPLLLFFL
jgi:hypothetical protein